jgi:hypothetical protein
MTKYQREQITLAISDQLEIITEQFIMASQNKGAIPLIEIDLLKESVRTLYQQINDWQTTNDSIAIPNQVVEEKTIIVTSPIEEPQMVTAPTEVLFNEAVSTVELASPVVETAPVMELTSSTIEAPVTEEIESVVAETPNTTSEGFLSRILKAKPSEKTAEVKEESAKPATNIVAEQPKQNQHYKYQELFTLSRIQQQETVSKVRKPSTIVFVSRIALQLQIVYQLNQLAT